MLDPVRVVNQLNLQAAQFSEINIALQGLKEAIVEEGLDRPLVRPSSGEPSVRDLELIAWELVL